MQKTDKQPLISVVTLQGYPEGMLTSAASGGSERKFLYPN